MSLLFLCLNYVMMKFQVCLPACSQGILKCTPILQDKVLTSISPNAIQFYCNPILGIMVLFYGILSPQKSKSFILSTLLSIIINAICCNIEPKPLILMCIARLLTFFAVKHITCILMFEPCSSMPNTPLLTPVIHVNYVSHEHDMYTSFIGIYKPL